jgi:hypothetical protein
MQKREYREQNAERGRQREKYMGEEGKVRAEGSEQGPRAASRNVGISK